jgi:hypothetical protein
MCRGGYLAGYLKPVQNNLSSETAAIWSTFHDELTFELVSFSGDWKAFTLSVAY